MLFEELVDGLPADERLVVIRDDLRIVGIKICARLNVTLVERHFERVGDFAEQLRIVVVSGAAGK